MTGSMMANRNQHGLLRASVFPWSPHGFGPRRRLPAYAESVVVAALLLFASALAATAPEKVTVQTLVGRVEVRPSGSPSWRPAKPGMAMRMGWDVRTYLESMAELSLESGSVLRLGENSVVQLTRLLHDAEEGVVNSQVEVATGQVWANVKKLVHRKSQFVFETPTALASIRGTSLGIQVTEFGTAVDVFEGEVRVRCKSSRDEADVGSETRAFVKVGLAQIRLFQFADKVSEEALKDTVPPVVEGTETEKVLLEEGLNRYELSATDLAGNKASKVAGEIYYLPGPLEIEVIEPDENPYRVDDLPPMPRGVGVLYLDIEVEIRDGIGTVPETIRYVRARGNSQDVTLTARRDDYLYHGRLTFFRGHNTVQITVEDIAGNRATRPLDVYVGD